MQTTRKPWKLLLSLALVLTLLAGCSNADKGAGDNSTGAVAVNKEGFPIVNELVTLTLMAPDVGFRTGRT